MQEEMGERYGGNLKEIVSLGILLSTLILYVFIGMAADPDLRKPASLAFGFQLACWAGAFVLLNHRNPHPELRVSDPGLLYLFWCALYLILPTIFWLCGAKIPWEEHITTDLGIELLWLHGIFIITIIGCYLAACPGKGIPLKIDVNRLPSGWVLFLAPIVLLIAEVLLRVAAGGSILPERTYGDTVEAYFDAHQTALGTGGLGYVWFQVRSKVIYYPVLIQGIGLGLIISRSFGGRRYPWHTLAFVGIVILAMIVFGSGARSGFIMVFLVGLILADLLVGPIPWRYLLLAIVPGLVLFELLGYYRVYRDLPLDIAISDTMEAYLTSDIPVLGEFTGMLSKEALVLQYVRDNRGIEGLNYLYQQFLALIPSQLVPWKLSWEPTGNLTSRELLGRGFFTGGGAAGTIIGDSFRFLGTLGVPLLAAILGGITGWTQRWLMSHSLTTGKTSLLRLGIWASFLGWAFGIIRNDLGNMLVLLLYSCAIPLLVLTLILSKGRLSIWVEPLSRIARQSRV